MFRFLMTFIAFLILLHIIGCGADDDEVIEHVPANFLEASPPEGYEIAALSGVLTLIFDAPPGNVSSNVGEVTVINRTVTITKLPWPGPQTKLEVVVTWADGTIKLLYPIAVPCVDPEAACE
ncbi:MAG: hypothetical protein OXU36_07870 [Candidatus Poribacteria bacterium]|nr:hypothetical protein [Candidatus Poribacteria bacterium]